MAIKRRRKVTQKSKKKAIKKKIQKKIRSVKKRFTKAKLKAKTPSIKKIKENIIGVVTHYFPKVRAGVIKLKAPLAIGDTVKIKGHTTDFVQNVISIQIDHLLVNNAKKGQEIGLLVDSRVRQNDTVYKV